MKKFYTSVVVWIKAHIAASVAIAASLVAAITVAIVVPVAVSNNKKNTNNNESQHSTPTTDPTNGGPGEPETIPTLSYEYVKGVVNDYKTKGNYTIESKDANVSTGIKIDIDGNKYRFSETMLIESGVDYDNTFLYSEYYGDWLKRTVADTVTGLGVLVFLFMVAPASVIPNVATFFEKTGTDTVGIHSYVYQTDTEQYYFTFDDKNSDISEIKYSTRENITESFVLKTVSNLTNRNKNEITLPTKVIDFNDSEITMYELKHFTSKTIEELNKKSQFTITGEAYFDSSHSSLGEIEINCDRTDDKTIVLTSGSNVRRIEKEDNTNKYYMYNGSKFVEMDDEDVEDDGTIQTYLQVFDTLEKFIDLSVPRVANDDLSTTGSVTSYEIPGDCKYEAKFDKDNSTEGGKYFTKFTYIEHGENAGAPVTTELKLSVTKLPTDYE